MDLTYSFGEWLGRRRRALGLTQRQLAERAYCSVDMLKKIETDRRRPSPEMAQSLASALALPQEQLDVFIECARGLRPVDHLWRAQLPRERAQGPAGEGVLSLALPVAATPFVGREDELQMLARLLSASRLVTIVGAGGMGKTRLALAHAEARQGAAQPVAFVSLADLDREGDLALAMAQRLGLPLTGAGDATSQLLAALRRKTLLLVLDNLEQLRGNAALLVQMQEAAPGLTILATSRERLGLPGEQLLPLQGLDYPSDRRDLAGAADTGEMTARYAAVRLFVDSARRVAPDFEPYDRDALFQICHMTGGMPLALELAAAWMDSLTLPDLVQALQGNLALLARRKGRGPAHHDSVQALLDTTWSLLGENERATLARLAVFRGGFTRAAAEAVADASVATLAALVGRSMVQLSQRSARYTLHELMRQYGLKKLEAMGERGDRQRRHFSFYLDLAQTGDGALRTAQQAQWLARLDAEQDNARQALSWSLSQPGTDAAQLAVALCWYWRIRNHVLEARQWLAQVLAQEIEDTALRAALHFHAGHMAWMQGAYESARQHQVTSGNLWQSLGAVGKGGLAYSRHALGMIENQEGALEEARAQLQESLRLFEESGDAWGVAFAQQWLGGTILREGDADTAREYLSDGLHAVRQMGDRWAAGLFLSWLAWLEWESKNLEEAFAFAEEARQINMEMKHWHSLGATLHMLGRIANRRGEATTARRHYAEAMQFYAEMGNERNLAELEAAVRAMEGSNDEEEQKRERL